MKLIFDVPATPDGQPDFARILQLLDATYEISEAEGIEVDRDEKRQLNEQLIEQHKPGNFEQVTQRTSGATLHLEREQQRTRMFFDSDHGSLPIRPTP